MHIFWFAGMSPLLWIQFGSNMLTFEFTSPRRLGQEQQTGRSFLPNSHCTLSFAAIRRSVVGGSQANRRENLRPPSSIPSTHNTGWWWWWALDVHQKGSLRNARARVALPRDGEVMTQRRKYCRPLTGVRPTRLLDSSNSSERKGRTAVAPGTVEKCGSFTVALIDYLFLWWLEIWVPCDCEQDRWEQFRSS